MKRGNELSNENGLTLLEVLIALVILAIGLLGLSGMQVTAMHGNSSGFKSTTAVSLADQRMQQLANNLQFTDALLALGVDKVDGNLPFQPDGTVTLGGITYNGSYTVTNGPAIAGVTVYRKIAYTVSWNDRSFANNTTLAHSVNLITWVGDPNLGGG